MKTKQAIAVIGASGEMGSALAKSMAKGNYRMLLQSIEFDKVEHVIDDIKSSDPLADVEAVDSPLDACWEADIIVLAVPYTAEEQVAESIKSVVNQKIVISMSNPPRSLYEGLAPVTDISAAEELQKQLPNAKVVKAFNTVFAGDFDEPMIDGEQIGSFVAGNNEQALEVVCELVKTAGFQPILSGRLSASRILESMQSFSCSSRRRKP